MASLLWYLTFLAWIVVLIMTIVHCVTHVRPVWATVLVILAMAAFPLVGVAVYWAVFVIRLVLRERTYAPPDEP